MTIHLLRSYIPGAFGTSNGTNTVYVGDRLWLDATFDASTDYRELSIFDVGGGFGGDHVLDELGDDLTQTATVSESDGTQVATGPIYLEQAITLTDGNGNDFTLYTVEMDGTVVGLLSTPELVPGVTYEVSAIAEADGNPSYSIFSWPSYDPDLGQTYEGGAYSDEIIAGAGDDTISSGGGSDWIEGGDGNDTIYYGSGGATQSEGDTVYGGAGDDLIDDVSGSEFFYDDTLYGEAGNDTLWGGGGDDALYGGADNDTLFGEEGDDTLSGGDGVDILDGGSGNDIIDGGAGDDALTGGSGEDTFVFQDGSGHDAILDFDMGDDDSDGATNDQIDVSALTDAEGNPIKVWDVSVSDDGSGNALLSFPNGESIVLTGIAPAQVDTGEELYAMGIPCFCSGTRIMTPSGERPVEALQRGDLVSTFEAGPQPILWHGQRRLDRAILKARPELLPIVIRDGTLGNRGDLWVSPQHGLVLSDPRGFGGAVFARALHLERSGDGRIRRASGKARGAGQVIYHHLLLPRHVTLIANGMRSESLYPGRFALSGFDRAAKAELFGLFPALEAILHTSGQGDLVARLYGPSCLPYLKGREVKRVVKPDLPAQRQGRIASQHQIERIDSPVPIRTEEAATRFATPYMLAKR
ncbi:Hint domain-containing protein [Celeribacter sp. ULVN23_4]